MDADAQLKRLRWRCRRGTKELDALVGWWLQERWPVVDADRRQAFEELMNEADPDLWDWMLGHAPVPRDDWQAIVDAIRTQHRL